MADNVGYTPGTGATVAADEIAGVLYQRVKPVIGVDGSAVDVSADNPMPVTGPLTDAQLRATAVPVSGTFWQATQPVSAASLPLPTGAATEATIATIASVVKAEDSAGADGDNGFVVLAQRRDSDSPSAGTDGDYTTLKMDESGRLKVAVQPAAYPITTGNITAINGQVAVNVSRVSNIMIQMRANPTVSNQNVTFEASLNSTNGTDGNWITVQAVRSNANTIETATGNLSATPAYGWECSVNGMNWFRVRATAHTSGTAEWIIQPAPYATEPIPAAQVSATQPVSGTVTANIGTSGMVVYTDSSTNLGSSGVFTGTSRDGGTTPAYNLFVANVQANQAGTIRIEKSTDNTTWRRASKDIAVAANAPEEVAVKVTTRYNRVVYTNGSVAQTEFLLTSAYHRI